MVFIVEVKIVLTEGFLNLPQSFSDSTVELQRLWLTRTDKTVINRGIHFQCVRRICCEELTAHREYDINRTTHWLSETPSGLSWEWSSQEEESGETVRPAMWSHPIRRYQSRKVEIPNIKILLYLKNATQPFHSKSFSIIAVPNSWERSSREDDSRPSDQEIPRILRNPNNWAHLWTLCWRRMSVWIVSCTLQFASRSNSHCVATKLCWMYWTYFYR